MPQHTRQNSSSLTDMVCSSLSLSTGVLGKSFLSLCSDKIQTETSNRWSYIRTSSTASVVPLRHDEYPRFITGAWPYYIAAISTSVTFLAFVAIWLSLGEGDRDRKGKKKAE